MNSFLDNLENENNFTLTENGAITHKTTKSAVLDMFSLGAAYRNRSEKDCILLFKKAFEEDETLALKCLFYLRDVRGGAGERRFFRVCFKWLCDVYPEAAKRNLDNVSEFGRWDDLIYAVADTKLEDYMLFKIKEQLVLDLECKTPSLLGKWLPSENASSYTTTKMANKIRKYLKMTHKEYRKTLSKLRERINIVERLMSENRWEEIKFEQVPSKAGLIYRNAFAKRDADRYAEFINSKKTKVNARALYPYEIAHQAFICCNEDYLSTERLTIQKYWDNLPNYYGNKKENGIAIVDVSGSMYGQPIEAAVSLGAYIAEKAKGPFANHFITFSSNPELVEFNGIDITDKFKRAERANWGNSTNIEAVFNLLLNTIKKENVKNEDVPQRLYIFSDMEFDKGIENLKYEYQEEKYSAENDINTLLEDIAKKWKIEGYELPQLIFWNLNARQDNIPMLTEGRFVYISGLSPIMVESILSGKDGWQLCYDKLMSKRYENVK